ncbi:uncharacterized protein MYCFIDRAFT_170617 [Pseudocercospora fijiensis CIRAD86]|uniref:Uncharacterized protein n=1 Tax=Pseudocercospora fijiensis (strain CIRAD86) TaxID=383855 RepID=N1Q8A3_PSEFD|nr:uncharacterized protein MYCFIDRAFT_170617 [Pseudocercospora fijiensis CIRAD86]EME89100.1 hypothetical protein MYCFIDRAFT_170617 [Pseudocercospora fijiensis CIRAD86]
MGKEERLLPVTPVDARWYLVADWVYVALAKQASLLEHRMPKALFSQRQVRIPYKLDFQAAYQGHRRQSLPPSFCRNNMPRYSDNYVGAITVFYKVLSRVYSTAVVPLRIQTLPPVHIYTLRKPFNHVSYQIPCQEIERSSVRIRQQAHCSIPSYTKYTKHMEEPLFRQIPNEILIKQAPSSQTGTLTKRRQHRKKRLFGLHLRTVGSRHILQRPAIPYSVPDSFTFIHQPQMIHHGVRARGGCNALRLLSRTFTSASASTSSRDSEVGSGVAWVSSTSQLGHAAHRSIILQSLLAR